LAPLTDKRSGIPVLARGPPPEAGPAEFRTVEIVNGPERFEALVDPRGETLYILRERLPQNLHDAPEVLTRLLRATDLPAFRKAIADPEATLRLGGEAVPTGKEPLIAYLEAGRKGEAAALLASDPGRAREALARDLPGRKQDIERYLEQGHNVEALRLLETALRVHPDNPELRLLKGLAETGRGRVADALALGLGTSTRFKPQTLLDAVNRQLQRPGRSPDQRRSLRAVGRVAATRDLGARKKSTAAATTVVIGATPATEVRLPAEPQLAVAKAADLPEGALLYLDDTAGLNNRDWSPSARAATLRQAVESGGVELYEVQQPDLALQLAHDTVRAGPDGGKYVRIAPRSCALPSSYGPTPPPNGAWPDDDDDDQVQIPEDETGNPDPAKPKMHRKVYLLKKKARP
jgi:hypothetical protein